MLSLPVTFVFSPRLIISGISVSSRGRKNGDGMPCFDLQAAISNMDRCTIIAFIEPARREIGACGHGVIVWRSAIATAI
jgi:hypothetical protein